MTLFTDTHAHLTMVRERLGAQALEGLLADYQAAWDAATAEGRQGPLILDAGVEAEDFASRSLLSGGRPFIRLAAGIWPSAAALANPLTCLTTLQAAIERAGAACAAVGEGGLDYHHMNGQAVAQRELFAGQIALAERFRLPLIVHSRDAAADTLDILKADPPAIPVIIHCFGYGPRELRAFLDLGCFISFAGNLTYKSATALRESCALVPEDRLLLETDSPYMNPEPERGRPSTPRDVARSYRAAAELRGVSVEDLSARVTASAHALFRGSFQN